jgi:hypothetical protein
MSSSRLTAQVMRLAPLGSHRESATHVTPGASQTAFSFDEKARMEATQVTLRQLFGKLVREAGGVDWLCAALDKEPSYASKISEALNGVKDRKVQIDWLAPLLDDEDAAETLLSWLSERCGYEPPVRRRVEPPVDEINRAAREVIAEIKDEEQRELMRARIAKRLGVRPDEVRL